MNFGEKKTEFSPKAGEDVPVWESPKYKEAKAKAEEIINSGKYGLSVADFWILMNATKNGDKMIYTSLIISHNGVLKINDKLDDRFNPDCVMLDKDGYNGSLVYSYCNAQQGIYEVGEVSAKNCKNDYPYAMAYKRLFDRVVLKLSKLAYSGIMSDSESEEFTQHLEVTEEQETTVKKEEPKKKTVEDAAALINDFNMKIWNCEKCGKEIEEFLGKNRSYSIGEVVEKSMKNFGGHVYCVDCAREIKNADKERNDS